MYKGYSILAMAAALNEAGKIGEVVRRVPRHLVDMTLVVDDGSDDGTAEEAEAFGAHVIRLGSVQGAGAAVRTAVDFGRQHGYDILVVMAGNNKDAPEEIMRLISPIVDQGCDFVQGSRFLAGGAYGNMPLYRNVATRLHPLIFSLVSGKKVTDSTNGFRAFRLSLFREKKINLWQDWLNEYELEPYLYYQVIAQGYRTMEVPVTKIYPPREMGFTKMKPITGWWSILRPLILLWIGFRK